MTLSREMRKDLNRWLLPRLVFPLVMVAAALILVLAEQSETTHRVERETIRNELSDIDHRIKQEECLIRPFGQIIRREPTKQAREVAQLCDPDQALPDLRARRDRLEERLRGMGAFEEWE